MDRAPTSHSTLLPTFLLTLHHSSIYCRWVTNPTRFSNQYYRLLLSLPWKPRVWDGPKQFAATAAGKELMMLPSDMALTEDAEMRKWVEIYAKDKVRDSQLG